MRAVTKHAINNMASSFEPNAHLYAIRRISPTGNFSNLFTGLHAKVDLHNLLLERISAGEEKPERFAELGHQLEVQTETVSERPQAPLQPRYIISNITAVIVILFQRADSVVEVFESCDDVNSVKTAELDRRAAPTAPCKQYQVVGGRCAQYLHGRVSPMSHPQSNL